jgi:hypothetical protein
MEIARKHGVPLLPRGGNSITELLEKEDKTLAMRTMTAGLSSIVAELYTQGR